MEKKSKWLVISHNSGGEVTLTEDLTLSDSFNVLDDLTINLNGHSIIYNGEHTLFDVQQKATLTINGNDDNDSSIQSSACIAIANEGTNIYVNGGDHVSSGTTVYKSNLGNIYISKGDYRAAADNNEELDNPYEATFYGTEENIHISGGSFFNWDPKLNNVLDENGLSYTNETYIISESLDAIDQTSIWYTVGRTYLVEDNIDLGEVKGNPAIDHITVTEDIQTNLNIFSDHGELTIDMDNHILKFPNNGTYIIAGADNTRLIIKNATIYGGVAALAGTSDCELILENCTIDISKNAKSAGYYCIYTEPDGADITVTLKNCTFIINEDTSKGSKYYHQYICALNEHATIHIENCTFGGPPINNLPPFTCATGETMGSIIIHSGTFGFDPTSYNNYSATLADLTNESQSGPPTWIYTQSDQ